MKNSYFRNIAVMGLIAYSWACSTELKIPDPLFEVTGYEINQVIDSLGNEVSQVSFQLSGDPDIISFYSGEIGNDYQYADGRWIEHDALNLSFTSNVRFGSQPNQFSVWLSTDFNGEYTFEDVTEATWTDITDRFTLGTDAEFLPSGNLDIRPYMVDGEPFYLAFKYVCHPISEAGGANTWRVRNFNLYGETIVGDVPIANQSSADWSFVDNAIDNPGTRSRLENNGTIMLANGNNTDNREVYNEAWAVSKAFELDVIDNGPDRAISIKRLIDPPLSLYQHNYTQSGHYTVRFIAKNAVGSREKQYAKTFLITIP